MLVKVRSWPNPQLGVSSTPREHIELDAVVAQSISATWVTGYRHFDARGYATPVIRTDYRQKASAPVGLMSDFLERLGREAAARVARGALTLRCQQFCNLPPAQPAINKG